MIKEVPQETWIQLVREFHAELDRLINEGGASASDLESWRDALDEKVVRAVGVSLRERRRRR